MTYRIVGCVFFVVYYFLFLLASHRFLSNYRNFCSNNVSCLRWRFSFFFIASRGSSLTFTLFVSTVGWLAESFWRFIIIRELLSGKFVRENWWSPIYYMMLVYKYAPTELPQKPEFNSIHLSSLGLFVFVLVKWSTFISATEYLSPWSKRNRIKVSMPVIPRILSFCSVENSHLINMNMDEEQTTEIER